MKKFKLYFWYFICFSFIGWFYEVLYYFIAKGKFINSGTMVGPWLPIYGWGGIIVYFISRKFKNNPVKVFCLSFILCGVIEYATSFYLEKVYGLKWWDYSDFMFNLNGRICLLGLLAFAFLSVIVMYFVLPLLEKVYDKVNTKVMSAILYILLSIFIIDFIYSTIKPNKTSVSLFDVNLTIPLKML